MVSGAARLCVYSFLLLVTAMGMNACHSLKVPPQAQYYRIDFGGMNRAFTDLRTGQPPVDAFVESDTVLLRFDMQAEDVRNTFYLDGEELNASYYNAQYGYCYHFIMPAHDVKLTWKSRNLMEEER